MSNNLKRKDIIFPELSYKIVGILFDVYNELGYGYHEKYYQKAISKSFLNNNINFKEQVYTPLIFQGEIIGKFFLDFLIDDKIVLEIKKDTIFSKKHIDQTNHYLKSANKKLALLANFNRDGVKIKRLVNLKNN